jgi:hypothetical protein
MREEENNKQGVAWLSHSYQVEAEVVKHEGLTFSKTPKM